MPVYRLVSGYALQMPMTAENPPRTALVFGASGQIGTELVTRLVRDGWHVHAVSRQQRSSPAGVHWLQGSLGEPPALPAVVDVVFSCGPLDAFSQWYAHAALQCPRVIAFSSTSVMVKQDSQDPFERDLAARLAAGEQAVLTRALTVQTAATLLRPTLVWGAGMDRSLSRIAALAGRWGLFVLPNSARGKRQPVHVSDLASAAMAVIDCPTSHGQVYALGGGQVLSYQQMVRQVLAALPGQPRLWCVPGAFFSLLVRVAAASGKMAGFGPAMQARMQQDLVFDIGPAQRDFGYAPRGFAPNPAELGMDQ